MIENLQIKNIALIKEINVNFNCGLNVLSGETGAGKSIIIDSINFLMGSRAGKDFIKTGAEEAEVSGLIILENELVLEKLAEIGIEIDDDRSLLITRKINRSSKSVIRINGKAATLGMLKEISQYLIDFHGQHEHQSLLKSARHIELLDRFCGSKLDKMKLNLKTYLSSYKAINEKIRLVSGDEMERNSKLDFLKFQMAEIEEVDLKPGEEAALIAERKILANMENLIISSSKALELLYTGNQDSESALDKLYEAVGLLQNIYESDSEAKVLYELAEGISAQLDDLVRGLRKYSAMLEQDPQRLNEITERLELIFKLKRKYGSSIEKIISYYEKISEEYGFLVNSSKLLNEYNDEKNQVLKKVRQICNDLHQIRAENGKIIENQIELHLKDLGMKDARFKINIELIDDFNINGSDRVEFLIAANAGEPLKQLSKIASGGEMSRVMLAMKTVLAEVDNIDTFIFDEIDTGVSGRTAQKVAEKLAVLSAKKQILCITHLPQIASMSDSHYLIEKSSENNNTRTKLLKLDELGVIAELARLIGGVAITENTINTAKELKELADKVKKTVV